MLKEIDNHLSDLKNISIKKVVKLNIMILQVKKMILKVLKMLIIAKQFLALV